MARGREEKKAKNEQVGEEEERERTRERSGLETDGRDGDEIRRGTRGGSVDAMRCIIHFWPGQRATASTLLPPTQPTIATAREVLIGLDTTPSQQRRTTSTPVGHLSAAINPASMWQVRVIASSRRNDEIVFPRSDRIIPRSNSNIVRRIGKLVYRSNLLIQFSSKIYVVRKVQRNGRSHFRCVS